MTKKFSPALAALLSVAALQAPSVQAGTPAVFATASTEGCFDNLGPECSESASGPVSSTGPRSASVSADASFAAGTALSAGSATARASWGSLGASASVTISNAALPDAPFTLVPRGEGASAEALFDDTWTVNVPRMATGTVVHVLGEMLVEGNTQNSATWFASLGIGLDQNGGQAYTDLKGQGYSMTGGSGNYSLQRFDSKFTGAVERHRLESGSWTGGRTMLVDFSMLTGFRYDVEADLSVEVDADARAPEFEIVTSAAQFFHTAVWQGITAVEDANGHALTDFNLSSGSGNDYRLAYQAPVPLPQSVWLLAGALVVLHRRQGSRSA